MSNDAVSCPTDFDAVALKLYQTGDLVAAELTRKFEAARASGSPEMFSPLLGHATEGGTLGENGSRFPTAPIKYAVDVRDHVALLEPTLLFFTGLTSAFEIGVGPGYLMRLLIDLHGIKVTGCDIEISQRGVYKALRDGLGLSDLVIEHRVEAFHPVPIPEGTEALIVFASVFDKGWGVEEYKAFLTDCTEKLTGPKLIFWRLNRHHSKAPTRQIISHITTKPILNYPTFRVTNLNELSPIWW